MTCFLFLFCFVFSLVLILFLFHFSFSLLELLLLHTLSPCAPRVRRYVASIMYLTTLLGTLYSASVSNVLLTMVLVVVQICAALWYVASYIPYAQTCLWGTAQRVLPV
jgi:hypothetical protein